MVEQVSISSLPPRASAWSRLGGWALNRLGPGLRLLRYLEGLGREKGELATFRLGTRRVYFLNHPELVKEVLVTQHKKFLKSRGLEGSKLVLGEGLLTSEKELHRRQRRLLQPAFFPARMPAYARVMA